MFTVRYLHNNGVEVANEVVVKVREARLSVSWQRFENTDISFRQCSL